MMIMIRQQQLANNHADVVKKGETHTKLVRLLTILICRIQKAKYGHVSSVSLSSHGGRPGIRVEIETRSTGAGGSGPNIVMQTPLWMIVGSQGQGEWPHADTRTTRRTIHKISTLSLCRQTTAMTLTFKLKETSPNVCTIYLSASDAISMYPKPKGWKQTPVPTALLNGTHHSTTATARSNLILMLKPKNTVLQHTLTLEMDPDLWQTGTLNQEQPANGDSYRGGCFYGCDWSHGSLETSPSLSRKGEKEYRERGRSFRNSNKWDER